MDEDATVLLGVPTMYVAELEVMAKTGQRPRRLRTGLASGSAVSQALMNQLREKMGVQKMLIAYGMTETSPVTFITALEDPDEKGTTTVGRVVPHTAAKVVDKTGKILRRGERGELCTSGFALQKGYWKNEEKTREAMRRDESGVLWMHTGDEALLDADGYAHITGRIKDIIIRGTCFHYMLYDHGQTDMSSRRRKHFPKGDRRAAHVTPHNQRGQRRGYQK